MVIRRPYGYNIVLSLYYSSMYANLRYEYILTLGASETRNDQNRDDVHTLLKYWPCTIISLQTSRTSDDDDGDDDEDCTTIIISNDT